MRNLICLVMVINLLLICMPGKSYAYATDSQSEMEWEYLTPIDNDRDVTTLSLNILKKIPAKKSNFSSYRGITITRPRGEISLNGETRDSSAVGIGPVYMIRYEPFQSGRMAFSLDMSGGLLLYDKKFPAGGRNYNFMWRIGPQLIYKIGENYSVNIGYKLMHVSNGGTIFGKGHNPSYDAKGFSLGILTHF
ncbi:MAG: Lipid 3-O-deacylase-related protein [Firmicutes bacterium]|nr:Lipid 3-O-deacylase-related protein [Bacillota bacterium]